MCACFAFQSEAALNAAELDDCVSLFWSAAPCPKSALIWLFDISAMVDAWMVDLTDCDGYTDKQL